MKKMSRSVKQNIWLPKLNFKIYRFVTDQSAHKLLYLYLMACGEVIMLCCCYGSISILALVFLLSNMWYLQMFSAVALLCVKQSICLYTEHEEWFCWHSRVVSWTGGISLVHADKSNEVYCGWKSENWPALIGKECLLLQSSFSNT